MLNAKELVESYLSEARSYNPVKASASGLTAFDDRLGNPSRDRAVETIANRESILKSLNALDYKTLPQAERLDCQFATALIEADLVYLGTEPWATRPDRVVSDIIDGVFQIVMRPTLDGVDRWPALLSRLLHAPDVITAAAQEVDERSSLHACELAIHAAREGAGFLNQLQVIAQELRPELAQGTGAAVTPVQIALDNYQRRVMDIAARASGDFALGVDGYDTLLRSFHRVPYDHVSLLELGMEMIDQYESALSACALEIDPTLSWREIVTTLKNDHADALEVIPEYRKEIARSRDFVDGRRLVTIPAAPDEEFEVTETPSFMQSTIPYGFVSMAPVFSRSGRSVWHITLPSPNAGVELRKQKLQGHNRWNTWAITFHEGYPGHHLHALHLKSVASDIRRQFTTSVFIEGWGLYTEDLMAEQGYLSDPRVRLIQLLNGLWRAVRVVVDTGLHTRGMTVETAAEQLVQQSRLEPANALVEAGRYAITPTYAASYLVGRILMLELRKRYFATKDDTDLLDFHDQLLSFGAIPIDLIEREMIRVDG